MFELASKKAVKLSVTINPGSVPANTVEVQTFTVPGLQPDMIVLGFEAPFPDIAVCQAYVSGANELSVVFSNPTSGAINPSTTTCRVVASKI